MTDPPPPQTVTVGLTTKSAKIRALALAGYLRTEIAALLEIRYQHVRQVLEQAEIGLGKQQGLDGPRARVEKIAAARRPESVPAARLLEAGFVRLGQWTATADDAFMLDSIAPTDAGVYAFAVDGVVRYVGLTQTGLRTRMGHYVRGHVKQRTSSRVKALILDALRAGHLIDVLIAIPEPLEWKGLPVNTAAGLEAGLIRMIQPEWNMQGVRS